MAWNWKKQASAAYRFSLARLALNALLYADEREEFLKKGEGKLKGFDEAWNQALAGFLDHQDVLSQVQDLREQILKEMELVVAFTDGFRFYEHAFNRAERRFGEGGPVSSWSDEALAECLIRFIASGQDINTVNRRIQNIIGQLPVRFTRQKYYSMVREALEAYVGSEKRALDNMLYMLKCGTMTVMQEAQESREDLTELFHILKQISFQNMTAESYQKGSAVLGLATERLKAESEFYGRLQNMVNDLYVLCLTHQDAVRDTKEEAALFRLLQEAGRQGRTGGPVDFEALEEELCEIEGVQEQSYERFLRMEPAPEPQAGEPPMALAGRQVELLLSTSPFAPMTEEADGTQGEEVTSQDVEKAMEEYIACADPVLKTIQKPVARAIMAGGLEILPVSFSSMEELGAYVKNSLSSCTDVAEKEACVELLEEMMEREDYAF